MACRLNLRDNFLLEHGHTHLLIVHGCLRYSNKRVVVTVIVWFAKSNMCIFLNLYEQSLLIPGLNNLCVYS